MLLGRIELPTSPLPRVRSTTELQQRLKQARPIVARRRYVKRGLMEARYICKAFRMSEQPRKNMSPSNDRAERLAAKLRENLRRRKAQAREIATEATPALPKPGGDS